jgi:hypothetical protein
MSITLTELLAWSERLSDQSSEDARMLRTMIEQRERALRACIADVLATVSQRENWKLHRCASVARSIERIPVGQLESVERYFQARSVGNAHAAVPEMLRAVLAEAPASPVEKAIPAVAERPMQVAPARVEASIVDLYGRMNSLESLIAPTPGYACGIQGVRIMRVVALMSKARSARIEQMRIGGTQAVYRHM